MKIGKDKFLHVYICTGISLLVTLIVGVLGTPATVAALCGYVCALGTGLGKEYGDKINPYNVWDWNDVLADIIGAVLGAVVGTVVLLII